MKVESLRENIESTTIKLLEMANNSCWNRISSACEYILTEIDNRHEEDFSKNRIRRKITNSKKEPTSLAQAINRLRNIYSNLYDVNLYIYQTRKNKTIIEIKYLLKTSLDPEYLKSIKDNDPMLHCKLPIPPYASKDSSKYDVNWQLGGIRHIWKLFYWRTSMKFKTNR